MIPHSRQHGLRAQKMNRLVHETCRCLAVTALLLIGAAIVLLLIKAVEGFGLIAGNLASHRRGSVTPVRVSLLSTRRFPFLV